MSRNRCTNENDNRINRLHKYMQHKLNRVLRIGDLWVCVSLAYDSWPSSNVWTVTKWLWPYFLQCVLHRWHYFIPLADWKGISTCAEHTRQLAVDYSICNLFKSSFSGQGIGDVTSQPSNSLPNCNHRALYCMFIAYVPNIRKLHIYHFIPIHCLIFKMYSGIVLFS